MRVHLRAKFEVSSIILTSFRQGWGWGGSFTPPNSKQTPKKPTRIRVKVNSVILKHELWSCLLPRKILLTENCIARSLLQNNNSNNNDKKFFLTNVLYLY